MSTDTTHVSADLSYLTGKLVEGLMVRASSNFLSGTVTLYHPPGPAGLPPVPWPASVDVQSLPTYRRRPESLSQIQPGEAPDGPSTLVGPYPLAERIPVWWPGVPGLTLTEPLPVGSFGLILLAGKHQADTFSTGAPGTPELPPNPLRLSDAVFLPGGALPGVLAAALPPGAAPQVGQAPRLGPAGPTAATAYLALAGLVWTLAGQALKLGGEAATLGVARQTDPVNAEAALITYMTALETFLAGFGFVPGTPFASLFGVNPVGRIAQGSTVVTSL